MMATLKTINRDGSTYQESRINGKCLVETANSAVYVPHPVHPYMTAWYIPKGGRVEIEAAE